MLRAKTGNYPGVTVARYVGTFGRDIWRGTDYNQDGNEGQGDQETTLGPRMIRRDARAPQGEQRRTQGHGKRAGPGGQRGRRLTGNLRPGRPRATQPGSERGRDNGLCVGLRRGVAVVVCAQHKGRNLQAAAAQVAVVHGKGCVEVN